MKDDQLAFSSKSNAVQVVRRRHTQIKEIDLDQATPVLKQQVERHELQKGACTLMKTKCRKKRSEMLCTIRETFRLACMPLLLLKTFAVVGNMGKYQDIN